MSHRYGTPLVGALAAAIVSALAPGAALAVVVHATAAIHLAGRTDIAIPPLGGDLSGFPLDRPDPTPSQTLETRPIEIAVMPGEALTFAVTGTANFAPGGPQTGPDGDVPKDVIAVGGISGYVGLGGSLVGVFLDEEIPLADPPPRLDFSPAAIGTHFSRLDPALGQVFFIGDGLRGTGTGVRQVFVAPEGATRLALGTLDGAVPGSFPGFYVDNTGSYEVMLAPEAGAGGLAAGAAIAALVALRGRGPRTEG